MAVVRQKGLSGPTNLSFYRTLSDGAQTLLAERAKHGLDLTAINHISCQAVQMSHREHLVPEMALWHNSPNKSVSKQAPFLS